METMPPKTSPLISAEELKDKLTTQGLIVIDARSGKDALQLFALQHIQGALHVDLDDDLAAKPLHAAQGGRHPLPAINSFSALLGRLGIQPASSVVVYDDKGGANAAARFWWMMRAAGHEDVRVLDGGWQAALAAGIAVSTEIKTTAGTADYPVNTWQWPLVSLPEVSGATQDSDYLIIDVREAFRYRGESEPIDLVAGHIPNAVNVPYLENLSADGKFISPEKLGALYKSVIGDRHPEKVIVHCGSGVTACHTLLALDAAGITGANLYVGSWSEWSRNDLPVAKGEQ
ncbi:MAG: sulfurtransferase [Chitinophagales bacterium]|nr:sulfurtransferase [Chitinophagales bacterium]